MALIYYAKLRNDAAGVVFNEVRLCTVTPWWYYQEEQGNTGKAPGRQGQGQGAGAGAGRGTGAGTGLRTGGRGRSLPCRQHPMHRAAPLSLLFPLPIPNPDP